ncbi:MAG: excinuclease ABC subunit UvrA, partial [Deltaproteobacteria bacterium]|nr:excinuclease ABC subunit UvrA [Deltaproteobacteria bacterium]
ERDLADDATEPTLGRPFRLVVDRFDPSTASRERVADALSRGFAAAGRAIFRSREGVETLYETTAACPEHGPVIVGELTPRHFSFNSQIGACTVCQGLGAARAAQIDRLFIAPHLPFWESLEPRAAAALGRSARGRALIERVLGRESKRPVSKWSDEMRTRVLDGTSDVVSVQRAGRWGKSKRKVAEEKAWPGLLTTLEAGAGRMDWLFAEGPCRACKGGRLRPAMLAVTVSGEGIAPFTARSVDSALEAAAGWHFGGEAGVIAERPLLELVRRLGFLSDVGLGYLGLDRAADTLSGGESQRIRLASQLGSALTGTTYVLDEPTIGLHPRDTDRLITTLEGLRDLGNTVILVEHDADTIRRADHVIDLGPLAGVQGGSVVASGTPAEILADPASLTGRWLSGAERIAPREGLREPRGWITVREPRGNNLRGGVVRFPIGVLTAVTGVSGSGKSTLVLDTLAPGIRMLRGAGGEKPAPMAGVETDELPDEVIVVDQAPIGRTPRSTPATYTGVFDGLRRLYAETPAAKLRGWEPGRFSYNIPGGRCELCEGRGATLVEMHFLPDVWVTCDACGGRRYNRETLEVRWRDRSIADLLAMRIDEAVELFSAHRVISRPLRALADVGLGYLTLGQPATTLSGGEAQRVKLATGLTSRQGRALYVLDEPTTGLHLSDVAQLLAVLHRLVDAGHTVLTIEHHLSVITQADHLVDLGPEGGDAGGRVVGEGTPAAVALLDT